MSAARPDLSYFDLPPSNAPHLQGLDALQVYEADVTREDIIREYGVQADDIVKLSSNENPLGCSPHVTLAVALQLGALSRYPDGAGVTLRQYLGDFHGVSADCVTLANGAQDLLALLAAATLSTADGKNQNARMVYAQYALSDYQLASLNVTQQAVCVPAQQYGHDLAAMAEVINATPECRLVLLANPNNPTGTLLTAEAIAKFVARVPSSVLVVIDEAYIEFTPNQTSVCLTQNFDNVVILRTFSKAYGLAGLKIGYAISSSVLAKLLKLSRQAMGANVLALAAAQAALADQTFLADYLAFNAEQRQALYKGLDSLGIEFVPSVANFVMVNVSDGPTVYQALLEQGIVVRVLSSYGLDAWIRVSVGLPEENNRFLDTLAQVLA